MTLSKETLDGLRNFINEGVVFRSGPQLIRFFAKLLPDSHDTYGPDFGSRKEYTEAKLVQLNDAGRIEECLRYALLPDALGTAPEAMERAIRDCNKILSKDGWISFWGDGAVQFRKATQDEMATAISDLESKDGSCYKEIVVEPDENDDYRPINKPFDPELIDIDTRQQAISNVVALIQHDEIDLHPAFQRSGNIWDVRKQSRLIESLLLRIPLPAFYFDVSKVTDGQGLRHETWQVIDGLQRLCAINNFVVEAADSRHKLRLTNVEFLSQFEGKAYEELPFQYQRIINETQLTVYLIKDNTPSNVKFNIFKRVNTGGVPLTPQEIRHALHQGVASEFLERLATSLVFREATGGRILTWRMLDREFVNRFLAFYCLKREAFGDLESYMDSVLTDIETTTEKDRTAIEDAFYDSLRVITYLFGKYAFGKLDAYPKVKPINKVLFEVLTVSMAKLQEQQRKLLMTMDQSVALKKYVALFQDGSYEGMASLVSTTTGALNRINQRYRVMSYFLSTLVASARSSRRRS